MTDSLWTIPILFLTGAIAGLVDSIAGGGGLITIPVMLSIGLPPQVTLGTNKFQASFGSFTAAAYHVHKKNVDLKDAWLGIVCTLIGAAIGTWGVQQIDAQALGKVIPFLLAGILVYTFFTPSLGEVDSAPKLRKNVFYLIMGLALGFYDGFFGPGVGSFWAIAFVALLGFNLSRATGYTKLMNFVSNIVSLIVFAMGGNVWPVFAIPMAVGQIVGARLGSGLVVKRGAAFIRPVFVTMVVIMIFKVFYDKFIAQ
ncbi:MAG: TSUP family transporter [Ignavibacteriae bacterium]|nr:TSUP family transporter [Ignavibacteriota bacterium]